MLDDDDDTRGTNTANHFEFRMGDLDVGFADADIVVERSVSTSAVHQGYIEPHSGTAMWHDDGSLTIYSSSQGHFTVRDHTARLVGIPVSKVKAVPMEIGGGFGAKLAVYMEPLAALLARKAHAPVKVSMNRTEVFEATGPTSGTEISCRIGATNDGKITAAEVHLIFEAGAFPGSPVAGAANCVLAAYDIPNTWIEGYDIVVNRPQDRRLPRPRFAGRRLLCGGCPGRTRREARRRPYRLAPHEQRQGGHPPSHRPVDPHGRLHRDPGGHQVAPALHRVQGRQEARSRRRLRFLGQQHRPRPPRSPWSTPMARSP